MGVKTAKDHLQTPPVTHSVTSSSETYDYHKNDNVSFPLSIFTRGVISYVINEKFYQRNFYTVKE